MNYHFSGEEETDSPSLIYYKDIIEENIKKIINIAGGAQRLWPHVKSHKTTGFIRMQIESGINRFKCATIAEAEICALSGAEHALLAYPLVGPAIERFPELVKKYIKTDFWASGDDIRQLELLGKTAAAANINSVKTLIDVNMGMNRTGVLPELLEEFYRKAVRIDGLDIKGFHCYDGHLGIKNFDERQKAVISSADKFFEVKKSLEKQGYEIPVIVMGGTPTFPCHVKTPDVFLSPGTIFIQDNGYSLKYPDLDFTPGAAILSRVISHPAKGLFTLDTGNKAIAADPAIRGVIADLPDAKPLFQSEEHWVWSLEETPPPIGTVLYIIPTHICPSSALYQSILVIKNGKRSEIWEVDARNRRINV